MNPLSIVLFSLQGAATAIKIAEGFVKDESIKTILAAVGAAIDAAVSALAPHATKPAAAAEFVLPQ